MNVAETVAAINAHLADPTNVPSPTVSCQFVLELVARLEALEQKHIAVALCGFDPPCELHVEQAEAIQ
jgi:hypothetical protein